tara:strand:- start:8335 stop:9387 length:1053 start_codon:yes stop_codon:yes gene_type:complete
MKCPICSNISVLVYEFTDFPLHLPPSKSKSINLSNLEVYQCKSCDFLFNSYKDLEFYDNLYKNQISYVKPKLKSDWTKIINERNYKNILEIGGGINSIAKFIPSSIKITIVDPSISDYLLSYENVQCFKGTLNNYLDDLKEKNIKLDFDAIFMSHTLEHIPNPKELIDIISSNEIFNKSELLIELPNILQYSKSIPFYTFFFEHCSLFTPLSLYNLMKGFSYKLISSPNLRTNTGDSMYIYKPFNALINQTNISPESNLIISYFNSNIKDIVDSFIEKIFSMNSLVVHLPYSGGGSTSLFLYYLSKVNRKALDKLYLSDNLFSGYYVSSTGQLINEKPDFDLPIIKIIDK